MPSSTASDAASRTPLLAVGAAFAVNGMSFPSLLPRFPQIATAVGAGEAAFGLALAGSGIGGLLGGLLAPVVARRLGLVRTTAAAGYLLALSIVLVALAPSVPLLALAFTVAGLLDAAHDISMNEVALGEQARRDGSVMGRLHGIWSLGATGGTALGAAAAWADVPVPVHLGLVALLAVAAQRWSAARMRTRDRDPADVHVPATASLAPVAALKVHLRRVPPLLLLGTASLGAVLAEGTGLDWSALALRRGLDASPGVAGLGPLIFSAGVLVGRSLTDPIVDRIGASRLLLSGNALAVVSLAIALPLAATTRLPWVVLLGLAVSGLGCAANFPLLFGAGDRVAARLGLPEGTGASVVGTLPRLGGLLLPAAVGAGAQLFGLLPALGAIALGAVVVAATLPRTVR